MLRTLHANSSHFLRALHTKVCYPHSDYGINEIISPIPYVPKTHEVDAVKIQNRKKRKKERKKKEGKLK